MKLFAFGVLTGILLCALAYLISLTGDEYDDGIEDWEEDE